MPDDANAKEAADHSSPLSGTHLRFHYVSNTDIDTAAPAVEPGHHEVQVETATPVTVTVAPASQPGLVHTRFNNESDSGGEQCADDMYDTDERERERDDDHRAQSPDFDASLPAAEDEERDRAHSRTSDLGRCTHNDACWARVTTCAVRLAPAAMVVEASRDVETSVQERQRDLDGQAGVAIPNLPFDVAVSLIEEHLPDPADLAVLRAVNRGMRDAVDATGLEIQECDEHDAAERGYLSTLKYLRRRGLLQDDVNLCAAAARNGDRDELKALRAANVPWDSRTCAYAAFGGHFEALRWARENSCPWDEFTCSNAAKGGHLEVLLWARENGCPWDEWTCSNAAEFGHLEMLKWARENGCPWNKATCAYAAKGGHLEVLKWARENGCHWSESTCWYAGEGGHLEVLTWARENGCPWGTSTCSSAADGGHLEVLKWARENGCPWDLQTCALAAYGGHLEVLKWARENGCPWNETTCMFAAKRGHLEVLRWARENGCPWDDRTCLAAADFGYLNVLKWARENGCPWGTSTRADARLVRDMSET